MLGVWNIRLNVAISRFATRSRGDCDASQRNTRTLLDGGARLTTLRCSAAGVRTNPLRHGSRRPPRVKKRWMLSRFG